MAEELQIVMSKESKEYYQSRRIHSWPIIIHSEGIDGKPLCGDISGTFETVTIEKWEFFSNWIRTCEKCEFRLLKDAQMKSQGRRRVK